jgi:AbrB family looped-hinge helix DNA binding protein
METVTVNSKRFTAQVDYDGRLTIPKVIRQALKIQANDIVDLVVYEPERKRK